MSTFIARSSWRSSPPNLSQTLKKIKLKHTHVPMHKCHKIQNNFHKFKQNSITSRNTKTHLDLKRKKKCTYIYVWPCICIYTHTYAHVHIQNHKNSHVCTIYIYLHIHANYIAYTMGIHKQARTTSHTTCWLSIIHLWKLQRWHQCNKEILHEVVNVIASQSYEAIFSW